MLTIGTAGDQVRLDYQNWQDGNGVQAINFADGTVWSGDQLYAPQLATTTGFDVIHGTSGPDLIDGQGGGDYIVGGGGGDTIVFNVGYGQMFVGEKDATSSADNVLQFGAGITSHSVSVTSDPSGSVILTIGGSGDEVYLNGMALDSTKGVQAVTFIDGTTWTRQDVLDRMVSPGAENVVLGTTGSDRLIGTSSVDIFDGNGGTDYEEGDGGGDTFKFDLGYGQLEINEQDTSVSPDNVLQFGDGISPTDVKVSVAQRTIGESQYTQDFVLTIGASGDVVTLDNMVIDPASGVQGVEFADGTVWTRQDLVTQELRAATTGMDSLYGTSASETFDGLGGGDYEQGAGGGDAFVFHSGYGQLEINEIDGASAPNNVLQFGAGINPTDVTVLGDGDTIELSIGENGDRVTLDRMLDSANNGVQAVTFADGTIWSRADLVNAATSEVPPDGILVGSPEANVMDGKGAASVEYGRGGGDTFVFDNGYGQVQFTETDTSSTPNNIIQFGDGIAPNSIVATKDIIGDIYLNVGANGDQIELNSMLLGPGYGVQGATFSDGTHWSRSDILSLLTTGTSGNDTLVGSSEAETLNGMGGQLDVLKGGGGNDTYVFGSGSVDVEIDNHGTDPGAHGTLQFGPGISADDLWFTRENGNLVITDLNAPGQVTIDNWFMGDPSAQLSEIRLSDGVEIDSQLNQLISAMAAFTNNNPSFGIGTATMMPNNFAVHTAIEMAWHA